jgi:hypothetical protein
MPVCLKGTIVLIPTVTTDFRWPALQVRYQQDADAVRHVVKLFTVGHVARRASTFAENPNAFDNDDVDRVYAESTNHFRAGARHAHVPTMGDIVVGEVFPRS